ncbi:MAG TPA: hypothetical protein VIR02_20490 [Anaerolineales bacterium]
MLNTKLLASILIVLAVLSGQVGHVAAAPQVQETTPITGTVQSVTTETDASGVTTVLVTLLDDQGATQTLRVSVEAAVTLGLVTLDPTTQEPVVDETQVGQTVEIDPTTIIPEETTEESVHPIAWLLGEFFGVDPAVVDGYHEDGFGFGVIAQAFWISRNLTGTEGAPGDASLAQEILVAKQNKDFEAFFEAHPEYVLDGDIPSNWGQFKKALSDKKNNLGVIVSGQEDPDSSIETLPGQDHGNGVDRGNGRDNGNGKGKDKNKNKP